MAIREIKTYEVVCDTKGPCGGIKGYRSTTKVQTTKPVAAAPPAGWSKRRPGKVSCPLCNGCEHEWIWGGEFMAGGRVYRPATCGNCGVTRP